MRVSLLELRVENVCTAAGRWNGCDSLSRLGPPSGANAETACSRLEKPEKVALGGDSLKLKLGRTNPCPQRRLPEVSGCAVLEDGAW